MRLTCAWRPLPLASTTHPHPTTPFSLCSNQGGIKSATTGALSSKLREMVDKVQEAMSEELGMSVPMHVRP